MSETVFGPERPLAAIRAISELDSARAVVNAAEWTATDEQLARYARALENRRRYLEYGDTFRGH
jgi:hypothetical protein